MTDSNPTVVLTKRPTGKLEVSDFELISSPMPAAPRRGEVLCRNILLSISPGSRAWMNQFTYRDQLRDGEPMAGYTIAEVVAENGTGLAPGAIVECDAAWQAYSLLPASAVREVAVRGSLTHTLSVFGLTGLAGYFGMLDIGGPRPGETVVVSAAAGATGSVAAQIARMKGARVVGITGDDAKSHLLTEDLGLAAAVNYRDGAFEQHLQEACSHSIDLYFDNVGGTVLEVALQNMRLHGRVVCCGAVSHYDGGGQELRASSLPNIIVTKRLSMQGFIVHDYSTAFPTALDDLESWVASGEIRVLEDVREGLDAAPAALVDLLNGGNIGKLIVRIGADP